MTKFFYADNWFYNNYFLKLEKGQRYWTIHTALSLLLQSEGKIMVETGCARMADDWGAGMSTIIFSQFAENYKKEFHSVDIDEKNIKLCKRMVGDVDNTHLHVGDSIEFLKKFDKKIDLLYLDSLDFDFHNPGPSQDHCLNELQAAYSSLSRKAVVLMDDNWLPGGGKPAKAKEWLREQGWTCIIDHHQTLWVREV